MEPTTPRLIDRLASLRRGLEQCGYGLPSRRLRLAVTVVVAVVITGGLARLVLDDERAVTALPEPPPPTEGHTGAAEQLGQSLPASLVANVKAQSAE
jgi:hypothetical protein